MKLRNLSITTKLLLSLGVLVVAAVIAAVIGFIASKPFVRNYEKITRSHKLVVAILDASLRDEAKEEAVNEYAFTADPAYKRQYTNLGDRINIAELRKHATDTGDEQIFTKLQELDRQLVTIEQEAIQLVDDDKDSEALELMQGQRYEALESMFSDTIATFDDKKDQQVVALQAENENKRKGTGYFTGAALFGLGAICLALVLVLSRYIIRPIREIEEATIRLSRGDLDTRVAVTSQDEIGRLAIAFNKMALALRKSDGQAGEKRLKKMTKDLGDV